MAVTEILYFEPEGLVAGAVYEPLLEILPYVELPPRIPLTDHTTPVFAIPVTVAEYCCTVETRIFTFGGFTETVAKGVAAIAVKTPHTRSQEIKIRVRDM